MSFRRFVGVDWSGAKQARQSGIQVAEIEIGETSPRLIPPPADGKWSRSDVMDYIAELRDKPTLVGIDFAFSIPWANGILRARHGVTDARSLWALIDRICHAAPHLYAGPVWCATDSPFRPYIFHHQSGHRGALYNRKNLREVDRREGNAISIYHMVGPQVGAGSFAGMRMLHQLTASHGDRVSIWPFDIVDSSKTTIVEIYPSFFYRKARATRPTRADLAATSHEGINAVLRHFGAARYAGVLLVGGPG